MMRGSSRRRGDAAGWPACAANAAGRRDARRALGNLGLAGPTRGLGCGRDDSEGGRVAWLAPAGPAPIESASSPSWPAGDH